MKSLFHVSHAFGDQKLFDDTSVELPNHGVVALRGPNGCGKTTLLKLLGGIISTSCSGIQDWRRHHKAVYLDAEFLTLDYLRVQEVLKMVKPLTVQVRTHQDKEADQLITAQMMSTKLADLSLGQRQRLVLAVAVALQNVDVLLLDEPFNGLDKQASRAARKAITAAGEKKLILIATHEDEDWTAHSLVVEPNCTLLLIPTEARI